MTITTYRQEDHAVRRLWVPVRVVGELQQHVTAVRRQNMHSTLVNVVIAGITCLAVLSATAQQCALSAQTLMPSSVTPARHVLSLSIYAIGAIHPPTVRSATQGTELPLMGAAWLVHLHSPIAPIATKLNAPHAIWPMASAL